MQTVYVPRRIYENPLWMNRYRRTALRHGMLLPNVPPNPDSTRFNRERAMIDVRYAQLKVAGLPASRGQDPEDDEPQEAD
jgi:hypothetical protein